MMSSLRLHDLAETTPSPMNLGLRRKPLDPFSLACRLSSQGSFLGSTLS